MLARVKKKDTVIVVSGKDKGKQGVVIALLPEDGKIMVKDIALVTRHLKARRAGQPAGIKKEESFINSSKVMPVCPGCKKPCRVNAKVVGEGKKMRACNRCGETF